MLKMRIINAIVSGPRQAIPRVTKRARTDNDIHTASEQTHTTNRNEIDTCADTCVLGKGWTMISTTGQVCDVKGFHNDYDAKKDIPICQAASLWTAEDGRKYILIVNEGLFFGQQLDHSLINPNQARHYGIPVSDNPYDRDKPFGIDHEDVFIPFQTQGSKVYFDTCIPTNDELNDLPHIVLTDGDSEWDPHGMEMNSNRPYGEVQVQEVAVQRENKKRRHVPVENESDLCLGSISGAHVDDIRYERIVKMVASLPIRKSSAKVKSDEKKTHKAKRVSKRITATSRHSTITPERVAKVMNISVEKAKQMLKVTTQKGIRTAVRPIHKRYRVNHLDLHSSKLKGQWYIDWIKAAYKSLDQKAGAFVISNGTFTASYPTEDNKSPKAKISLNEFCQDVGVPEKLKSDRAKEFCGRGSDFLKTAQGKGIDLTYAEPERKNEIAPVDLEIREIRKLTHQKMVANNIPERLWDFTLMHSTKVRQFLPRDKLGGRTPFESVTGKTPDISEFLDFDMYDMVWYFPGAHPSIDSQNRALARWLGVSHRIGSDMCYFIVTVNGDILAETTVQHVTVEDMLDPDIKQRVDSFNEKLNERLNSENFRLNDTTQGTDLFDDFTAPSLYDAAYGNNDPPENEYKNGRFPSLAEADDMELNAMDEDFDKYIGARLKLDVSDDNGNIATVRRRAQDERGRPIGVAHRNPMLDTREFEVELENGETERVFANQIAMNLYSRLDEEGREILVYRNIIDHKKDMSALTKENGFITLSGGQKKAKKTTRGWKILVEFDDDTTCWMPLKDVKEASPTELAEYAINNHIDDEPAFAWWVPYTMKKMHRIINKVKTKYWRTTHKYGVRLPKSVDEALQFDQEMIAAGGEAMWGPAIKKEMNKASVAYEEVENATPEQIRRNEIEHMRGFQEITCHVIFDVKMDFTRKARFVANGAMTDTPVGLCYSSVVSRDSVRIAFLVAALNDLDVLACDIGNAYLNAPCKENIWFVAGLECGRELAGKPMKLVRALYGLKSSGASWRKMFKDFIEGELGFKPSTMDSDMYYRRCKAGDGSEYYELLLVYVDDVLCVSHAPREVLKKIGQRFLIKDDKIEEPKIYLGADIEKFQLKNGKTAWSIHSKTYVKNAVETVQRLLAEDGRQLKTGKREYKGPLPHGYKPELDTSDECSADHVSRFQQLIGILRWAVELGRVDIHIEVALMSQYQMNPRVGHLEALYMIFHYLWKNPMMRLVMDPTYIKHDENQFETCVDWKEFYGDIKEEEPPNMPEPLGQSMDTVVFVDADHASNVVTRRSHSGVLVFANNALVTSFCKRQNTVESSTFSSELVAMRIARDLTVALRLKLKSIGVPLLGPTNVYCDNQGVVKNTSIPESTLSKKHNSINYHVVREAAAAGILRVGKEPTESNLADALTKLLPYSRKWDLLGSFMYNK